MLASTAKSTHFSLLRVYILYLLLMNNGLRRGGVTGILVILLTPQLLVILYHA